MAQLNIGVFRSERHVFACWRKLHLQAFNNIDFLHMAHQPHVSSTRLSFERPGP